jgi:hypothetical protein
VLWTCRGCCSDDTRVVRERPGQFRLSRFSFMRAMGNQRLQLPELSDAEKRNIEINDQLLIRSSQTIRLARPGGGSQHPLPPNVCNLSYWSWPFASLEASLSPHVTFDNLTHRTYTHIAYSPHFALRNRIPTLRDSQARALRTATATRSISGSSLSARVL